MKKDVVVNLGQTPEVDSKRGIVREDGHIVRSKEWLQARIETLKAKEAELMQRLENAQTELKERINELTKQ